MNNLFWNTDMEQTTPTRNFLDPKDIIRQINITQGSVIADFGCGSGFFSLAFAESIREEGKVYSFDILLSALESVASKAKISGLTNIITKRVNLEKNGGSKLENNSVDWVIMKDMLFQNKMKDIILEEAYRVLKPGGKILLVEWNDSDLSIGPNKDLRISKDELIRMAEKQNFEFEKDLEAGDFHYGELFKK
jgi:ubiquinone/menaquinone biosynthesis C-methylase UbiE